MNEIKQPKKQLITYMLTVFVVMILLNSLIMPSLTRAQITETDYNTFITMTENDQVKEVEISSSQILFTDKDGKVYATAPVTDHGRNTLPVNRSHRPNSLFHMHRHVHALHSRDTGMSDNAIIPACLHRIFPVLLPAVSQALQRKYLPGSPVLHFCVPSGCSAQPPALPAYRSVYPSSLPQHPATLHWRN